jgi:hypothetical protein
MATGALLVTLGGLATQITLMLLTPVTLPSGAMKFESSLFTVWRWLVVSGEVIVVIGGIGAIKWAIRPRQ